MSIKKFEQVHVSESGQAIVVTGICPDGANGMPVRGEVSASEVSPGKWWVNRALVKPDDQRGHGLGTQLLHTLLATLVAKDSFKHVLVEPGGYNMPVGRQRKFYKRSGFKAARKLPGVLRWTKKEMKHVKASVS